MTKEELSKYYYLKQEIKQIEDKIKEIDSTFMRASLINCEKFERKLSNPQEKRMILIEKYEQKLEIAINITRNSIANLLVAIRIFCRSQSS